MKNRGGKRKGAGRKPAPYNTKTISFRVKEEWADMIKLLVKEEIKNLSSSPKINDYRTGVKKCFEDYYKDKNMPLIEVEENVIKVLKVALLGQIEKVSDYLPIDVYTKNVIDVKCMYIS
jgi:hypothetical protein